MDIYYVYAYLRSNGSPYYIGKGCKKRAYAGHDHVVVPKDHSKIIFLEENLEEQAALDLEIEYIKKYGRLDRGTGILENQTDGGDKPPNQKGRKRSAAYCQWNSERSKGRIPWNKGKKLSKEIRQKMSAGHLGLKASTETRKKMSIAKMGDRNPMRAKRP